MKPLVLVEASRYTLEPMQLKIFSLSLVAYSITHNQAVWGGGMIISLHDAATGNTVIVDHSNFTCNEVFRVSRQTVGKLNIDSTSSWGGHGAGVTVVREVAIKELVPMVL